MKMVLRIMSTACLVAAAVLQQGPVLGQDEASLLEGLEIETHGFIDVRAGVRVQSDDNEHQGSLGEVRAQLDAYRMCDFFSGQVRADVLYDDIASDSDVDLEEGSGFLDVREANLLFSPLGSVDVKFGRQILTWGTGDLLFINDMFPKDWQSFFTGRDEEYLKAPSDALFLSFFPELANIDVAYTPRFDADRYISGERLSYWNPMAGGKAGRNAIVDPEKPDEWFEDDEIALRVYKGIGNYEAALYAYHGFWKSPVGFSPVFTNATFPELSTFGASLRGSLGGGVLNAEAGYYLSGDDSGGSDPYVPNSETRLLVGFEKEVARDFSAGLQYYVELMSDYDDYLSGLGTGETAKDEDRHVVTLRLTRMMMSQDLVASLFVYYSPSDQDAYLRPGVKYKVTDNWLAFAGANIFLGEKAHTFFGQFEDNSNVYGGARYSF